MGNEQPVIPVGTKCLVQLAMKNGQVLSVFSETDRATLISVMTKSMQANEEYFYRLDGKITYKDGSIGIESSVIVWEALSSFSIAEIPVKSLIEKPIMIPPSDIKIMQ